MPSIAFADIAEPDFADTVFVKVPGNRPIPEDPASWANRIFSVSSAPGWIRILFGIRQRLVGLVGIKKGESTVFAVQRVENGEALISANDTHLDFRAAVKIDCESRLLQVTTVVKLHGWKGRLYWAVVSLFHGPVTRSMMTRAAGRFSQSG